ncbi:MAG TPA: amino acid ABC transporter ATP-binding protein [Xanthobacteraceae bacterium]|jgi:general L-amino acid transport system ATP-binding protein
MAIGSDRTIMVDVQNLSKWFGSFRALNNINFKVRSGEKMIVCGPSGSGKSTMIRCINQLETHDAGRIIVDGIELGKNARSLAAVRMEVGIVFQQFNLFPHMTVLDNLTLAPMRLRGLARREAEDLAIQYLERVDIAEQARKYPAQLSGGQQQRVAIARALCMKPKIMLFDEPTSALDPEMIGEVLEVMVALAGQGMTMICVTHEMGFARRVADTMVFMDQGEIVEQAPARQFFSAPASDRAKLFLSRVLSH